MRIQVLGSLHPCGFSTGGLTHGPAGPGPRAPGCLKGRHRGDGGQLGEDETSGQTGLGQVCMMRQGMGAGY